MLLARSQTQISAAVRHQDLTLHMRRYIVLPMRPAATESWGEEQLLALVTRDSLLGVKVLHTPQGGVKPLDAAPASEQADASNLDFAA